MHLKVGNVIVYGKCEMELGNMSNEMIIGEDEMAHKTKFTNYGLFLERQITKTNLPKSNHNVQD